MQACKGIKSEENSASISILISVESILKLKASRELTAWLLQCSINTVKEKVFTLCFKILNVISKGKLMIRNRLKRFLSNLVSTFLGPWYCVP